MSSPLPEQEPLLSKADRGDVFSQTRTTTTRNRSTSKSKHVAITPAIQSSQSTRTTVDPVGEDVWKLPIAQRSNNAPLLSRLFVIPTFMLGLLGIFFIQLPVFPLWPLMRIFGDRSWVGRLYNWDVEFTKQLFGMLCESSIRSGLVQAVLPVGCSRMGGRSRD